jgi:hypothetical protein
MSEFADARAELPSAIASLPESLRNSEAAKLLEIVEELRRSYDAELRAILKVLTLDTTNAELVRRVRYETEFGLSTIDAQRTRCHNIDRIGRVLLEPLRLKGEQEAADQLGRLVEPLGIADNELLDDIGDVLNQAAAAAVSIDEHLQAGMAGEARASRERFAQEIAPKLEEVKRTLQVMNRVANELLDAV